MARLKKRADGTYTKTFRLNGKQYFAYGKTQKEATEKAERKKAELIANGYKKSCELTFAEYHERWLEGRKGTVKEATLRKQQFDYKRVADTVIDGAGLTISKMKIKDIETQNVRVLQKVMIENDKYSTTTINDSIAYLKHVLDSAMNEQIINFNPAKPIKALKRTEEQARDTNHRALTIDETKRFFDVAKGTYYYNVYVFLVNTGLRCGELGALKYSDIDMKKNRIYVKRTLTKTELGNYVIGEDAKTKAGIRDIPFTDELKQIIVEQKKLNAELFNNGVMEIDGLLFRSPEGNLLSDACVNRDIKRKCKKANVDNFTAHAFRDTFATRQLEGRTDYKTLQELMGHANIAVTMNTYAHVMDDTKAEAIKNMVVGI